MKTIARLVHHPKRLARPATRALLAVLALSLGASVGSVAPVFSQEPSQLLPASPPSHVAVFQVEAPGAAQYDEVLTVLDLEPNAWTYERRHDGMAFFSVLDGTVTVRAGGKETPYTRGQSFRQDPGAYYAIGNRTSGKARLITTTLTSPGSTSEANHPDAVRPAILPTTAFFGKATFNGLPSRFTLNQVVVDFRPGAGSGAHSHPAGQGVTIVMTGEQRQRLLTGDVIQKAGEVFVDVPNRPISHENAGGQPLTVLASYVFAVGAPNALPAVIPGVPPLVPPPAPGAPAVPPISPPRTGDGGLTAPSD